MNNRNIIDFFKVFKIFDLKKLDKQGEVKVVHDKMLGKKILAADGNVSTHNYITLQTSTALNLQPSLAFSHRYLYVVGYVQSGKQFCMQVHAQFNARPHILLFSTLYKVPKKSSNGVLQMPLEKMKSQIWTYIVIDLYQVCERYVETGQMKLSFRLDQIEIRASSKVRNIYQSDTLFDPYSLPKDMQLPLRQNQEFYQKYNYFVCGQTESNSDRNNVEKMIETVEEPTKPSKEPAKKKKDISSSNASQAILAPRKYKKPPNPTQTQSAQQNLVSPSEDSELLPRTNLAPRPKVTIEARLAAVQGVSLFVDNIRTVQAFVTYPTVFAVHKPISCMSINPTSLFELAVAYTDGSVSIWDIIRHRSLCYLQTPLKKIGQIKCVGGLQSQRFRIYMVGQDSKKRENILVISQSQILYQKISNYPIAGFCIAPNNEDSNLIVTFGYENIRIWRENPNNNILSGVGIYLGKMNRKISYNSCCQISAKLLLVADSGGYITSINLQEQKMQEMRKISEVAIDQILHLKQLQRIVIINFRGEIKVLDSELRIVDELELGNRVKNLSYRMEGGEAILNVQQHNKSTAYLNIDKGEYSFIGRSHTAPILGVEFMRQVGKIVTISQDSTIRIWGLAVSPRNKYETDTNRLEWEIKQEYQFVIQSGQSLSSVVTDDSQYIYVSFHGGRVRKINACNYQIQADSMLNYERDDISNDQMVLIVTHSEMSRNGKNILFCAEQRIATYTRNPENQHKTTIHQDKSATALDYRVAGTVVILSDCNLNALTTYRCPQALASHTPRKVLSKFSSTHKKFCICWASGSVCRVQVFDMRDLSAPKCQFCLQSIPETVEHRENVVACYSVQKTYEEYHEETGELLEIIQLDPQQGRLVQFPYVLDCCQETGQLQIGGLGRTNSPRALGRVDLPEQVSNLRLYLNVNSATKHSDDMCENMVICTGTKSNALYAIKLIVTNVEQLYHIEPTKKKHIVACSRELIQLNNPHQCFEEQAQLPVLQNQFLHEETERPNTINTIRGNVSIDNSSDGSVYEQISQQQKQQVDQIKNQPHQLKKLYQREQQMLGHVQHFLMPTSTQEEHFDNTYVREQENIGTDLMFGWNKAYNSQKRTRLIWQSARQSLLLLCHKTLILHLFREPVSQNIIRLPIQPSLVDKMGNHIFVAMGNQIRMYDEQMNYIRSLVVAGCTVESMSVSICEGFLVALSRDLQNTMTYIQVIDIITTGTLCSSYLTVTSMECHKVLVNPFQSCLEYIVYSHDNVLFYRMTSIMSLQVQELPKIKSLISTNTMGQLTCLTFLKVDEEELAAFGTQDGSMLIVDSRAAQVLIVCRSLVKSAITDILYQEMINQNNGSKQAKLCIITQSNIITVFELKEISFRALVRTVEQQPSCLLTIDSKVCMNSKINKLLANSFAFLALSKYHTLWLIDINDRDTLKIMSAHSQTNDNLLISEAVFFGRDSFISGANDGCLKLTSLRNLEQINQIYKPKRKVTDILLTDSMLVASFDSQIYFYSIQPSRASEWVFLGSTNMPNDIVKMQNIPATDNYLICTMKSLYMIYHDKRSNKFKLQIQLICDSLSHPLQMEVAGYNLVLVRQASKIDVWLRKQKRNQNILKQMSEVQQIKYYTMDVYQIFSACAHFVLPSQQNVVEETKEYIVCSAEKPVLQFRDFHEHTILREIEIGVSGPTFMLGARENGHYFVGDETGNVCRINHNGLLLEKIRVLEGPIRGIKEFHEGKHQEASSSQSRLLVFGSTVGIISI